MKKNPIITVTAYEHRAERAVALVIKAEDAAGERILRELVDRILREGIRA